MVFIVCNCNQSCSNTHQFEGNFLHLKQSAVFMVSFCFVVGAAGLLLSKQKTNTLLPMDRCQYLGSIKILKCNFLCIHIPSTKLIMLEKLLSMNVYHHDLNSSVSAKDESQDLKWVLEILRSWIDKCFMAWLYINIWVFHNISEMVSQIILIF